MEVKNRRVLKIKLISVCLNSSFSKLSVTSKFPLAEVTFLKPRECFRASSWAGQCWPLGEAGQASDREGTGQPLSGRLGSTDMKQFSTIYSVCFELSYSYAFVAIHSQAAISALSFFDIWLSEAVFCVLKYCLSCQEMIVNDISHIYIKFTFLRECRQSYRKDVISLVANW